jgi:cell division septation protein DedD
MKKYIKIIFVVSLILSLGLTACKKEAKAPAKQELTEKKVSSKPKAKVVAEKKVEPLVKTVPDKYFLILASFQNFDNAQRLQEKLTKEGFSSEIFDGPNGFNRVSYKAFSDRKIAFRELKSARATEKSRENWLYIKQ